MNRRILVADDEPDLVEIITTVLEKTNCDIETCFDGKSTIQALKKTDFDLIILDLLMPEPDGFEILQWIRGHKRTKEIPVIVVSGRSQERAVTRAFELGANQFITKPFDFNDLTSTVNYYGYVL